MRCINFDEHFADYVSQWMNDHGSDYANYDDMEADMPRVYLQFLNTPAPWLEGITPGAYFTQFEDPKDLVDWLRAYVDRGIPVPDLLQEQIQTVGKPCEKRLLALLKEEDAPEEARMTAIGLLRTMGSELPKSLYIAWQLNRKDRDELCDNAIESLKEMGPGALQAILEAVPKSNRPGQEALLDVLADYPGNEQVFRLAMKLFRENPERQGLLAGYLGKLGDERALPALMDAASDPALRYLDFIELRCAIERLGGAEVAEGDGGKRHLGRPRRHAVLAAVALHDGGQVGLVPCLAAHGRARAHVGDAQELQQGGDGAVLAVVDADALGHGLAAQKLPDTAVLGLAGHALDTEAAGGGVADYIGKNIIRDVDDALFAGLH